MWEHPKRLYEQTHSGAVHSSHFIQKPLGERLLSAAEIWQRDGLRAALYETGGFLEKGVAIFDNYQKWRHDREPMGCIETAVTAEILHAFVPGLTRLSDWINERIGPQVEIFHIGSQIIYFENPGKKISDVLIPSIIGGVLTVAEHLENAGISKKIYESTSGAISVMATAAFVIPDIQNTWTADSGNTNFQRVQKTIIQLAGAGASIAVGKASGAVLKAGIGGAGHTAGASLVAAVPIAIGINLAGNLLIQEVQLRLYEDLGIH